MKTFAIITALAVIGASLYMFSSETTSPNELAFSRFQQTYGRNYLTQDEYNFRLGVFEANLKVIDTLNAKNPRATFAVNKFADRTQEEMKRMRGAVVPEHRRSNKAARTLREIDGTSVDWTHLWNDVKNQGYCGSCWAFSATATFEARWAIKSGIDHIDELFAEQELVDCVLNCHGCNGGFMDYAFEYLVDKAFCHESEYPYTGVDGECNAAKCEDGNHPHDSGFHDITDDMEDEVLAELLNGPVAVAVDAEEWQFYSHGILEACGISLDHGVTLIQSNFEEGYVKIRNSWGSDWGEAGHIRLALGKDVCGYADAASVPTF